MKDATEVRKHTPLKQKHVLFVKNSPWFSCQSQKVRARNLAQLYDVIRTENEKKRDTNDLKKIPL